MQFMYDPENSQVNIDHNGINLSFSIKIYDRTKITSSTNNDLFKEINRYLAYLPANRQKEIFSSYQKISEIMAPGSSYELSLPWLVAEVNKIYQYLFVDELEKWLSSQRDIRYPTTAVDKVGDDLDKQKTYTRQDYFHLVVLTIGLRMMIPIWGEYQSYIKTSSGTQWKELVAMRIFTKSTLHQYSAVHRLRIYCESFIENDDKHISSAAFSGLSSSELPDWLLSGAIIKRLTVASIDDNLDKGGLVKNIYGHVTNALNGIDDNFGNVRPKNNSDIDDEDSSNLEKSRPKPRSTTGEIDSFKFYFAQRAYDPNLPVLEDAIYQANRLDPTIPVELVQDCFNHNLFNHKFNPVAVPMHYLAKWIYYDLVEEETIDELSLVTTNVTVFSVCQALCIHWGFLNAALMFNAVPVEGGSNLIEGSGDVKRPQTITANQLIELLPYKMVINSSNERQKNVATKALGDLKKIFPTCQWEVYLPPVLQEKVGPNFGRKVIVDTPPLIIEEMAQILIRLINQES